MPLYNTKRDVIARMLTHHPAFHTHKKNLRAGGLVSARSEAWYRGCDICLRD